MRDDFKPLVPGYRLVFQAADTGAAVWRRLRERRRIDRADRLHTHHKLMNLGFSARGIDGVLLGLQVVLGVLAWAAVKMEGYGSLVALVLAYGTGAGFFTGLHFLNRRKLRNAPAGRHGALRIARGSEAS